MYNTKIITLLVGLAVLSLNANAQKKQFTIAEATNGMGTTLAPANVKNASWQPGTDRLWQTTKRDDEDVWKVSSYSGGKETVTYVEQGTYPEKVANIPGIKWLDKNEAWFLNNKDVIVGKITANTFQWNILAALPQNADHITVDKSNKIAYTVDNNLWLWDNAKGKTQVTTETDKNVICGQSVHRDEFGIDKGIFFSPKGNYLAYYRMDQTMVNDYPIIRWDTVPAVADNIKYPMAGGTSHQVTLCVYNPATGKTVTMKTGEKHKDHYLTCVTWSPDEKYIYIAILNRDQNDLLLNKYDAQTGEKVQTLFEEANPKYVHPMHPLTFLQGRSDEFIWWSERDGYDHLYLYNTSGRLIRQITKGNWAVNEIQGINAEEGKLIITAAKESPIEKHIYSVSLAHGRMQRIDKGEGMHNALCSEDGKYVLDAYTGAGSA